MTQRIRSILLIAALAAILLAAVMPLLLGRPLEPVPPPLPSEQSEAPRPEANGSSR